MVDVTTGADGLDLLGDRGAAQLIDEALTALVPLLLARGWRMACAESCTGGLIAAACTSRAGSSDWFDRGWVTYSNAAKTDLLEVPAALIEAHGAVSEPVARAMAEGALRASRAQVAAAVTGIAGPGGAVPGKPVGTVWLGLAGRRLAEPAAPIEWVAAERHCWPGNRAQVRAATVQWALGGLRGLCERLAAADGGGLR